MVASDWRAANLEIRIGVSACLLGEPVRHAGGHQRDPCITRTRGRHFAWIRHARSMELGLGDRPEARQRAPRHHGRLGLT
jgi:uncharacterized protein YbbK (DUF523 family)